MAKSVIPSLAGHKRTQSSSRVRWPVSFESSRSFGHSGRFTLARRTAPTSPLRLVSSPRFFFASTARLRASIRCLAKLKCLVCEEHRQFLSASKGALLFPSDALISIYRAIHPNCDAPSEPPVSSTSSSYIQVSRGLGGSMRRRTRGHHREIAARLDLGTNLHLFAYPLDRVLPLVRVAEPISESCGRHVVLAGIR